jgi:hypothetical protein
MKLKILEKRLNPESKRATIIVGERWLNPRTNRERWIKNRVIIISFQGAYEQYGARNDILYFTLPIARKLVENNFTEV